MAACMGRRRCVGCGYYASQDAASRAGRNGTRVPVIEATYSSGACPDSLAQDVNITGEGEAAKLTI